MKKLTLKHLAPYLPYNLQMVYYLKDGNNQWYWTKITLNTRNILTCLSDKPILHPISDLTKTITHNDKTFMPADILVKKEKSKRPFKDFSISDLISLLVREKRYYHIPHWMFQDLIKWHFDLFGLIEAGLAIDINTLEK